MQAWSNLTSNARGLLMKISTITIVVNVYQKDEFNSVVLIILFKIY